MNPVWPNFKQRLKHETPQMHLRMRDDKIGDLHNKRSDADDIEIDRAGSPAPSPFPAPPQFSFDRLQLAEDLFRTGRT